MQAETFFDYSCDNCAAPVCERMMLICLSLGYEDELLCTDCLSKEEGLALDTMLKSSKRYILSRDCFKKPWQKFQAEACPKLKVNACPCQDLQEETN